LFAAPKVPFDLGSLRCATIATRERSLIHFGSGFFSSPLTSDSTSSPGRVHIYPVHDTKLMHPSASAAFDLNCKSGDLPMQSRLRGRFELGGGIPAAPRRYAKSTTYVGQDPNLALAARLLASDNPHDCRALPGEPNLLGAFRLGQ
jgi:hypothetical protein